MSEDPTKLSFSCKLYWKLFYSLIAFKMYSRMSPRGVMAKGLLCSLSDQYPWGNYELPYLLSYGLDRTTAVLLPLNNPRRLICY